MGGWVVAADSGVSGESHFVDDPDVPKGLDAARGLHVPKGPDAARGLHVPKGPDAAKGLDVAQDPDVAGDRFFAGGLDVVGGLDVPEDPKVAEGSEGAAGPDAAGGLDAAGDSDVAKSPEHDASGVHCLPRTPGQVIRRAQALGSGKSSSRLTPNGQVPRFGRSPGPGELPGTTL